MKTRTIAIFLSMMFATLTVAPDIIVLLDQNCDVSIILESSEEEERKKGEEKVKDYEIEQPLKLQFCSTNLDELNNSLSNLHLDNYSSVDKELTSPPPELSI